MYNCCCELGFRPLRDRPLAGSIWPVARAASLMLTKQVSTALLTSVLHVQGDCDALQWKFRAGAYSAVLNQLMSMVCKILTSVMYLFYCMVC